MHSPEGGGGPSISRSPRTRPSAADRRARERRVRPAAAGMRLGEAVRVRAELGGRGRPRVPGDKSIAHRWLLLAATARGPALCSRFHALDVRSTAACLAAARLARLDLHSSVGLSNDAAAAEGHGSTWNGANKGEGPTPPTPLEVEGEGAPGSRARTDLWTAGTPGTTMRLLAGTARVGPFATRADRGREPRESADGAGGRAAAGDGRRGRDDGRPCAGRRSRAGRSEGSDVAPAVPSAQVKGAVLLAGARRRGRHDRASSPRRPVTTPSAPCAPSARRSRSEGVGRRCDGSSTRASPATVPGDLSSAAFLVAAAALTGS